MLPGVTIVIPITRLTEDYATRLGCCLRSISRQTLTRERRDTIISLCLQPRSIEEKADVLSALLGEAIIHQASIVCTKHMLNTDYPTALVRNIGGRWGRREYLTFADVDGVLHPEALEVSLERLDAAPETSPPAVTCIQTAMTNWPLGSANYETSDPEVFEHRCNQFPLAIGTGCCTVTTQRVFEYVRGFDERYTWYGASDVDFTDRLVRGGYRVENLTETCGLMNMHQHHDRGDRDKGHRLSEKRRAMHDILESSKGQLVRNEGEPWGGIDLAADALDGWPNPTEGS